MPDTIFHFIDVGCGNMTLIQLPNGQTFFYDCNITGDNEHRVLNYVAKQIGRGTEIDIFMNSHRDADHMRGIKKLHKKHPIKEIRDTGVPGTTTTSQEYKDYMDLRRQVPSLVQKPREYEILGGIGFRFMNGAWANYTEPNDQSMVVKVECSNSHVMLAGDTSYRPWKEKILPFYGDNDLSSEILLASHHGSITFFDDPSSLSRYTAHIQKINPAMSLVSVGPNVHNLPDQNAIRLYKKHSRGSDSGDKVYTTQDKGTMKLIVKSVGRWYLYVNQA